MHYSLSSILTPHANVFRRLYVYIYNPYVWLSSSCTTVHKAMLMHRNHIIPYLVFSHYNDTIFGCHMKRNRIGRSDINVSQLNEWRVLLNLSTKVLHSIRLLFKNNEMAK